MTDRIHIRFETMTGEYATAAVVAELCAMMAALYAEDPAAVSPDHAHFPATINFLLAHPARGGIVLFVQGDLLVGYAILLPIWSNEFGGTLVMVDELFVVAAARNRGIAREFFGYLDSTRPFEAVAAVLEVTPRNTRALKLYQSLGFAARSNTVMTRRF